VSVKTYATGGIGDLFFMIAKDPNSIVDLYQEIVGKPVLTPQWALGWHHCRWGYTNLDTVKEVVQNFTNY
jgi:alpha-glucosidase (family GH31 glycosyl hydrolase)